MSIELEQRIDELEGKLRAFELELHNLRRMASAERATGPAPAMADVPRPPVPPQPPLVTPRPRPVPPAAPPVRPTPRRAPRRSLSDVVDQIDLFGPRGLAVAGGVVTLLGIVFFFVLAANRGWIGPAERVSFGAVASLAAFVAGVVVRHRFGQLHAALAAVGAGVAGGYATLAAATVLYGLLPPAAALPCAAGIGAAGLAIALAWSSELLAGLGLLGAVLSPAALALDEGVTAAGTGFGIVVLAAVAVVAVRRAWVGLLAAGVAAALPQVAWTVWEAEAHDAGATAVAAATVAFLLVTAFAWGLAQRSDGVGPVAAGLTALGIGTALSSTVFLFPDATDQSIALFAYAASVAGLCVVVARARLELAYLVGAGALGLAGVATADILTGASLAVVFAVQCSLMSLVAYRSRERRFVLGAVAYLALSVREALDTHESFTIGHASAALAATGLVASALAALAVGLLSPAETRTHASAGVLAPLEPLLDWLGRARVNLRAALAWLGFGLVALALDDLLDGLPLTLAFAGGAGAVAVAAWRVAELRLVPFAFAAAALTSAHAMAVDAPLVPSLYPELSAGAIGAVGVAVAAALAGVCAALLPRRQRGIAWLGRLDGVERWLVVVPRRRADIRVTLAGVGAALALGASGLALTGVGDAGHSATIVLWCVTGVAAVAVATPSGRWLVASAAGVLLVASLVKAAGYDWLELGEDQGAAELLVSCVALLLAGFVVRARSRSAAPLTLVPAGAAVITTLAVPFAVQELIASDRLGGVAMLAVTASYAGLAAIAQRQPHLRNLATAMWIPGLLALMQSEALLLQNRGIAVAYAATAVGLTWVGLRIRESRLVLGALFLLGATTLVTFAALTPPEHLLQASEAPGRSAWVLAACALAAAMIGVMHGSERGRLLGWIAGGLCVYVASLAILELAQRVSTASVQTDFERGHTAVSALWGLIGLGLLVAGLLRRTQALRLGGLALFGISLAKLFLYDLSELSSITRAFSFIAVGGLLLAGGFFLQRLGSRLDDGDARASAAVR